MVATSRLGVVVLAPRSSDFRNSALCRVLSGRFGAQVVVVPDRRMASPAHARRAVSTAVRGMSDVDIVVFILAGAVRHFARRSGDLVRFALPWSVPARPASMLPLVDLLTAAGRPQTSVVVCADLAGTVSPARVADVLPGAALLVAVAADYEPVCQDALAAALAQTDAACAVNDVVASAARLAGLERGVLVRRGEHPAELAPDRSFGALPEYVRQDMESPDPGSRLDAVAELGALAGHNAVAQAHLAGFAFGDSDGSVRDFASRLLHRPDRPSLPELVKDGVIPDDLLREAGTCPDLPDLLVHPGGPVMIGVDAPDGDESCRPRHHIKVAPYRLGRTVVTNRQYLAFILATGYPCPDHWAERRVWSEPDLPVVMVSWLDANRYCAWLDQHLASTGGLPGWRVRLPSEPEWEGAAGNGRGDLYPWGSGGQSWPANTRVTGIGAVTAVGRFPGSAAAGGCQDLIGNVWEWTRSRWGRSGRRPAFAYPYAAGDGRETDETPDERMRFVVRGGAYYYASECANSFTRNRMHATDRHPAGGFRVSAIQRDGVS